jgi:hypothetical protein
VNWKKKPETARNEFVIKTLRTRQPIISKIDEKLLVEVAGIDLGEAKFLCSDFLSYWRTPPAWVELLPKALSASLPAYAQFGNDGI